MPRAAQPRSPNARDAVRLMAGGATDRQVADALGITTQAAEKFRLRWIVLPENERLKDRLRELESTNHMGTL